VYFTFLETPPVFALVSGGFCDLFHPLNVTWYVGVPCASGILDYVVMVLEAHCIVVSRSVGLCCFGRLVEVVDLGVESATTYNGVIYPTF
jgi:hypothetical protein